MATEAGETRGGGGGERGDPGARESRTAPGGGSGWALIVFPAHGQVDEGEDVKLYHDGEAQEDGVEGQHADAQLAVKSPLVEMDAKDLEGQSAWVGLGGGRTHAVLQAFYLGN